MMRDGEVFEVLLALSFPLKKEKYEFEVAPDDGDGEEDSLLLPRF